MIDFTAEQIEKAERILGHLPEATPKALSRAINRASESARTEAARKVRQMYYIKHSDVTSTIKIYKASVGDLSAIVLSKGHLLSLTKFRVTKKQPQPQRSALVRWDKQKSYSIVARVKKGAGGPIKKAFVAKMKSGHLGVFHRVGKARTPVIERMGPSVPEMLGNPGVTEWVESKANEVLDQRLDHEIKRILEGNK